MSEHRSFDPKKLARMPDKAPEAQADDNSEENKGGDVSPCDLDAYVYQRLFLPIVEEKPIPLEGLDFGRISEEDLDDLEAALYNRKVAELLNLGSAFSYMRPVASANRIFI
jgi:hypothetical protein